MTPKEDIEFIANLIDKGFHYDRSNDEYVLKWITEGGEEDTSSSANSSVPPEIYNSLVDGLGLSARTLNCLKRAKLNRVGEILEKDKSELMQIRNFGQKSMDELFDKLKELNLLPEENAENTESSDEENTEE